MERKIGEIFKFDGEWYQCVEDTEYTSCINCYLYNGGNKLCTDKDIGNCAVEYRSDAKSICFKKLEKVGEPIIVIDKTFQKFTNSDSCVGCVFCNGNNGCNKCCYMDEPCSDNEIWIEIKQNKEDMEENKLKLRKFDLEAAKAGKPVCTRDGRKARIICFDVKGNFPMAVAIELEKDIEVIYTFHLNGRADPKGNRNNDLDLMMLPEKKEGWINIYEDMIIYESKEEAELNASKERELIVTAKVKWEE